MNGTDLSQNLDVSLKKNNYAFVMLGCAILMQFILAGLAYSTLSLYMNPILTQYPHISRTQFSFIFTIKSAVMVVVSMCYGPLLSKFGLRKIATLGGVLMALAVFVYSMAHSLWMLYLGAFVQGISLSFVTTTTCSLCVTKWFAKHVGLLLAIETFAAGFAGTIFNPVVSGWIVNYSWNTSMRITCVIALAATVLLALFVREDPASMGMAPRWAEISDSTEKKDGPQKPIIEEGLTKKEAFRTPNFWCMCVMFFLMGVLYYSITSTLAIFSSGLGYDAMTVGKVVGFMYTAFAIANIIIGLLADKFGIRLLIVSSIVSFSVCVVLLKQPTLPLNFLYVAAGLAGYNMAFHAIPLPLAVKEVFGTKDSGNILGIVVGIMSAGSALGAPILNAGYDLTGSYNGMFNIFAPIAIIPLILCVIFVRKIKGKDTAASQ